MKILLDLFSDAYFNDTGDVVRLFWFDPEIALFGGSAPDEAYVLRLESTARGAWRASLALPGGGVRVYDFTLAIPENADDILYKKLARRGAKLSVYGLLKEYTGKKPPWGALTGIRPTKLIYEFMSDGMSLEESMRHLSAVFDTDAEKARLLGKIIEAQKGCISFGDDKSVDIYIGIPFCPGRCSYCSFPSNDINKTGALVPDYVRALIKEMELTAPALQGLELRALYIGGGTPCSVPAETLREIITNAKRLFGSPREFTVEAGRPDMINRSMLDMLAEENVGRISINPQTVHDGTLRRIGRAHSFADIEKAFALSGDYDFTVNADLIAGLPGEDVRMLAESLDAVIGLGPENITVHSLALKRASLLRIGGGYEPTSEDAVHDMTSLAAQRLTENGYLPYYLYRQKYMAGQAENVGYALPGTQCLYNIDIMEETHHNIAFGAGAISKWLCFDGGRFERAPNVKELRQYIERSGEMAARKLALIAGR